MKFNIVDQHITVTGPDVSEQDIHKLSDSMCSTLTRLENLQIIEISSGADRAQVFFRFDSVDFLLYIECQCEAIWIEALQDHSERLQNLYQHLVQHTVMQ